jgi:hypothetical protein
MYSDKKATVKDNIIFCGGTGKINAFTEKALKKKELTKKG